MSNLFELNVLKLKNYVKSNPLIKFRFHPKILDPKRINVTLPPRRDFCKIRH